MSVMCNTKFPWQLHDDSRQERIHTAQWIIGAYVLYVCTITYILCIHLSPHRVAAAALVLSHFLALIFLLLYIRLRGLHRKTWDGWSWSCLREWWPFLRLGLPGMLMICLEWWAFEIGTVITGVLGRTQLAVNSVLFNTLALVYMVSFLLFIQSM